MRDLFPSTVIGFMANNLFPARLGEVLRALVLARRARVGRSAAFATIVLERVFDGATVLAMLFVSVRVLGASFPGWLRNAGLAAAGGLVLLLAFLTALKLRTGAAMSAAGFLLRPLPERFRGRALGVLRSFSDGLRMMHDWKSVARTSLLSVCLWVFPALSIHFALLASGIRLPVTASFFLLGVLCIGVAAPAAPGFVGTIQFVSVLGLEFFGVSRGQALGYSLIYHLSQHLPVTALGLVFFFSEGLSFSRLRAEGRKGKVLGGGPGISDFRP
jgi:hypothetical protein